MRPRLIPSTDSCMCIWFPVHTATAGFPQSPLCHVPGFPPVPIFFLIYL